MQAVIFRLDLDNHVVVTTAPNRAFTHALCGARLDGAYKLVPHADPTDNPPITCTPCLTGFVALDDLFAKAGIT